MNTEIQTLDIPALVKERAGILQWLNDAKKREMEIRKMLVSHFFPVLQEGTNKVEKDGYAVKVKHTITRKIDESALDSVMLQMPEAYREIGVLIGYKPALVLANYRNLDEDQLKVFDQALVISDDTAPQLEEIVDIDEDRREAESLAWAKEQAALIINSADNPEKATAGLSKQVFVATEDSKVGKDGLHTVSVKLAQKEHFARQGKPKATATKPKTSSKKKK